MTTIPNSILLHFFYILSIYFRLFLIISLWKWAASFRSVEQAWIPLCVKFGRYWSTGSGRKYFNFVNVFSLFPCHLPVVKGRVSLNLESLSFKDAVCQVWLILSQRFWKRRFVFLISSLHFCYSIIISTWTNLYLCCSRMLFCHICLKLAQWL